MIDILNFYETYDFYLQFIYVNKLIIRSKLIVTKFII